MKLYVGEEKVAIACAGTCRTTKADTHQPAPSNRGHATNRAVASCTASTWCFVRHALLYHIY